MSMVDKKEMEHSLHNGLVILTGRPELLDMAVNDVLNELDDGTSEMLQDRWGVAAHVVISTITDYNTANLVSKLAEYEDQGFICEYVGYLLLTEHDVNLETLLLEAGRQNLLDRIAPFVSPNLQYKTQFFDRFLRNILAMLNHHTNLRTISTIMDSYAELFSSIFQEVTSAFEHKTLPLLYRIDFYDPQIETCMKGKYYMPPVHADVVERMSHPEKCLYELCRFNTNNIKKS